MNIDVDHVSGDRFAVTVRGHHLIVDQPFADGGDDLGPTPTELFVASLAACVAFYARRAMRAEDIPERFPKITCSYTMSAGPPSRVAEMSIVVEVPDTLSGARRAAVQRAISQCTVHNSIRISPLIVVTVSAASAATPAAPSQ